MLWNVACDIFTPPRRPWQWLMGSPDGVCRLVETRKPALGVEKGWPTRGVCPAARVDRSCRPALFPHRLMVGVKALAPALPATAAASQGKLGGQDAALRCGPPFLPFLFTYLLPPVLGLLFECPMGTRERMPCWFGSLPC